MHINPEKTVQDIQEEFQKTFSHLKPEFFKKFHQESEQYAKSEAYKHIVKMSEILGHNNEFVITIDDQMTTEQFEAMFEEKYGIHVQLLRLQKDNWLVTTTSQELTLAQQNAKGIAADINIASQTLKDIDTE